MWFKINKDKIDEALLTEINKEYLVFKSSGGLRTIFLRIDRIVADRPLFKVGNKYSLEHVNGRARLVLL